MPGRAANSGWQGAGSAPLAWRFPPASRRNRARRNGSCSPTTVIWLGGGARALTLARPIQVNEAMAARLCYVRPARPACRRLWTPEPGSESQSKSVLDFAPRGNPYGAPAPPWAARGVRAAVRHPRLIPIPTLCHVRADRREERPHRARDLPPRPRRGQPPRGLVRTLGLSYSRPYSTTHPYTLIRAGILYYVYRRGHAEASPHTGWSAPCPATAGPYITLDTTLPVPVPGSGAGMRRRGQVHNQVPLRLPLRRRRPAGRATRRRRDF